MEIVKSTIEHHEPIIVQFFVQEMLELYFNFFDKSCDVNIMDADSLCLALAEEDLDECILPSKLAEWTEKRSKDCRDDFRADVKNNFFPNYLLLLL